MDGIEYDTDTLRFTENTITTGKMVAVASLLMYEAGLHIVDMQNVEYITRPAAQELSYHVDLFEFTIVNMSEDVELMMEIVGYQKP